MKSFPAFMKREENRVSPSQQNTSGIEGYYFEDQGGAQIAIWECSADRESKPHTHDFDEYMVCIEGEYTALIDGRETVLQPGDELLIPKGVEQAGRVRAGTRTLHVFGGKRITVEKGQKSEAKPRLGYRLITGRDDAEFCKRISRLLEEGYELHGSPAVTYNGNEVIAAQALVLPEK